MAVKVMQHAANVSRVPDLNFRKNPSISRLDTRANIQWCNVQCPYSLSVGKLATVCYEYEKIFRHVL